MPLLTICHWIYNLAKRNRLKSFNQMYFLVIWQVILVKKALTDLAVPLAKDVLPKLASNSSNFIYLR